MNSLTIFCLFIEQSKWFVVPFFLLLVCVTFNKTSPSGTSQACAACKYQRRRCTPECLLAPHFPADQPKIFQNAHRLFGVANMSRILKQIKDDEREDAMKSMKFEANMWEKFPQLGCRAVGMKLARDIGLVELEVIFVRSLIDRFSTGFSTSHESGSDPSWYADPNGCRASSSRTLVPQGLPPFQQGVMDLDQYDVKGKALWIQEQYEDHEAQYDAMNEALVANHEYNGSKKPFKSSSRSRLKGPIQASLVKSSSENEVRAGASWYGLTN